MKNVFTDGWELRCDAIFQAHNNDAIKAYICSPLKADTLDGVRKNMLTAKAYMLYALEVLGIYAYAPHAFLPVFLCDEHPNERKLALQIGKFALALSSLVYVCGDCITEGMKGEIIYAAKLGKQIYTFNVAMHAEVAQILLAHNLNTGLNSLHLEYAPMGSSRPVTESMLYCSSPRIKERYYGLRV